MFSKIKKIQEISSIKIKKYFIFLLVMMIIAMIFEMIGLSLIFPFIQQINSNEPNYILNKINDLSFISFNFDDYSSYALTIFTALIVIFIYTLKALVTSVLEWNKSKFLYTLQQEISMQLFFSYIKSDYTRHLKDNSSNFIRNISSENQQFTDNGVYPLLMFLTDLLVIVGILSVLIFFEPFIILSALITISIISYFFLKFTKKKTLEYGLLRQKYEGLKIKFFNEGIGSVKELKILGTERGFFSIFNKQNEGITHVGTRQSFIIVFPQIGLEFLAIIGVVLVVLVISSRNLNLIEVIPIMGLIVAGIFRLIPAFYRMISSFVRVRYTYPVIDLIHSEILYKNEQKNNFKDQNFKFKKMISLKNISYSYDKKNYIFKNFNLDVPLNKWVAIKGKTGSGKSTVIDIILGLLNINSGNIFIDNNPVNIYENTNWLSNFSYVPQNIFLIDGTIKDNIIFDINNLNYDEIKFNKAIESSQLNNFISTLDLGMDTVVGERGIKLSGGQKQRIGIARALYNIKKVMIMDEATNALDEETEKTLLKSIKHEYSDCSFILISHRKESIDFCDEIIELNKNT